MARQIFVSLPVADLRASIAFFTDPQLPRGVSFLSDR